MADFDDMLETRRVALVDEIDRGEALRLQLEQQRTALLASAPAAAGSAAEAKDFRDAAAALVDSNARALDRAQQAAGAAYPQTQDWRIVDLDETGRVVRGETLSGARWEARGGALVRIAPAPTILPDGSTAHYDRMDIGTATIAGETRFNFLTVGTWLELDVDSTGRPVWGRQADGSEWRAVAGVLKKVGMAPTYLSDGSTPHYDLLDIGKLQVGLDSGLSLVGPDVGDWQNVEIDANLKLVRGTKKDGSQYRVVAGNLVLLGLDAGVLTPGQLNFDYQDPAAGGDGSALITAASNVDYFVPIVGQSWAGGYSGDVGDATVTTVAQHPGFALMLSRGTEPNGVASTGFVDLKESARSGSLETPCSGMADVIMQGLQAKFGRKQRMIFGISAQGGQLYRVLKRGGPDYNETLRMVREAKAFSAAAGRTLVVPFMVIIHGENDWSSGTSRELYSRGLDQWREHYEEDIRRITGQTQPIRAYVHQTCYRGSLAIGTPTTTALAQLDAMRRNPMIRVAGPGYQSPGTADDNGGHLKAVGYRMLGSLMGQAILDDYFGTYGEPLYVRDKWWVSTTVARFKFSKPLGLEADDSLITLSTLPNPAGKGIEFTDGSAAPPTVTSVTIVAGGAADTLEVTLSAPPAGKNPRFYVAARSTNGRVGTGSATQGSGNASGVRSGIRSATPFFVDQLTSRSLYHWACQDELVMPPVL